MAKEIGAKLQETIERTRDPSFARRRESLKGIENVLRPEWQKSRIQVSKVVHEIALESIFVRLEDPNEKCREEALGLVRTFISEFDEETLDACASQIAEKVSKRIDPSKETEELRLAAVQICDNLFERTPKTEIVPPMLPAVRSGLNDVFPDVKRASARLLSSLVEAAPQLVLAAPTEEDDIDFIQQIANSLLTRKNHSKTRTALFETLVHLVKAYPLHEMIALVSQHVLPAVYDLLCDTATAVRLSLLKFIGSILRRHDLILQNEHHQFYASLLTCVIIMLSDHVPSVADTAFHELIAAGEHLPENHESSAQAVVTHYFVAIANKLDTLCQTPRMKGTRQFLVTSCLLMLARPQTKNVLLCLPQAVTPEGVPTIDNDEHISPAAFMTARLCGLRLRELTAKNEISLLSTDVSNNKLSTAHTLELISTASSSLNSASESAKCASLILSHVKSIIQEKSRFSLKQQEVWESALGRSIAAITDTISMDPSMHIESTLDLLTATVLCVQVQERASEDSIFVYCMRKLAVATGVDSSEAFVEKFGLVLADRLHAHIELPLEQSSWQFILLEGLARIAPILISGKKLPSMLSTLLYHTSQSDINFEVRMAIMSLLLHAVRTSRAKYSADDINAILQKAVMTNLDWSPGKRMLALRKTALAILNSLLEFPMRSSHWSVIKKSAAQRLAQLIAAHTNDNDVTCRQLSVTCLGKLCVDHSILGKDAGKICLQLIERLNDANIDVQVLACGSLATCLRALKQDAISTIDLNQIAEILMLHIDENNTNPTMKTTATEALRALSIHDASVLTYLNKEQ